MITYTVKTGDTLSQIAYRYQTTTAILKGDNPGIVDVNVIRAGQKIMVRTSEEYAKDKAEKAKKSSTGAGLQKIISIPPTVNLTSTNTGVKWRGIEITAGQKGVVTIEKNTTLYELDSKGNLKVKRTAQANETYRAYGESDKHGGLYMLGGAYVKKQDASFEVIPAHMNVVGNSPGSATIVYDNESRPAAPAGAASDPILPQFEMPGYRRTRMQVKKADGKALTMELRLLSVNAGMSNHINPSRTNEGWALHIGGKNLSVLSISGFLLDTLTNREADDFLLNYHSHLTPKNSGKYFGANLTTIMHKNREYKGLIQSLNVLDQSDAPIDRKFSMSFMVLAEKSMTTSEVDAAAFTISRGGASEEAFFSDLKNMLTNPITGKYNTHL